jgi:hypothetical protein
MGKTLSPEFSVINFHVARLILPARSFAPTELFVLNNKQLTFVENW